MKKINLFALSAIIASLTVGVSACSKSGDVYNEPVVTEEGDLISRSDSQWGYEIASLDSTLKKISLREEAWLLQDLPQRTWGYPSYTLDTPGTSAYVSLVYPAPSVLDRYLVQTAKYTGWDSRPGDFNAVRISRRYQTPFTLEDENGFLKSSGSKHPDSENPASAFAGLSFPQFHVVTWYLDEWGRNNFNKFLIFMSKPKTTGEMPLVYIVFLTETDIKLIFCRKMMPTRLDIVRDYCLELQEVQNGRIVNHRFTARNKKIYHKTF